MQQVEYVTPFDRQISQHQEQEATIVDSHRIPSAEERRVIKNQGSLARSNVATQAFRDRLEQRLAELGLEKIQHQFPVEIYTIKDGMENKTLSQLAKDRINDILSGITHDRTITLTELVPDYFTQKKKKGIGYPQLKEIPITSGYDSQIFDIEKSLSEGTAQGTVYKVDIHPSATLHYISNFNPIFGLRSNVPAILKKSPIYDTTDWKRFVALSSMSDMIDRFGSDEILRNKNLYAYAQQLLSSAYISDTVKDIISRGSDRLNSWIDSIWIQLQDQYRDINNDAYVDAIGYYFGSKLVEYGLSPFFPLLYGTFRAFDSSFFGPDITGSFGDAINHRFPVQATFIQPLNGDLYKLIDSGWFYNEEGDSDSGFDSDKILSMFAQITFGLDTAQKTFGMVLNDFHGGNLMYEDVGPNHHIFYRRGDTYYRVPTYGKLYKAIDFGRATFDIGGYRFGSITEDLAHGGGWNLHGMGNDLLRITSIFATETGLDNIGMFLGTEDSDLAQVGDFILNVTTCEPGTTLFDRVDECGQEVNPSQKLQSQCEEYEFRTRPYLIGSSCQGGIPEDNIRFFNRYIVPKEQVPANAIVYSIL